MKRLSVCLAVFLLLFMSLPVLAVELHPDAPSTSVPGPGVSRNLTNQSNSFLRNTFRIASIYHYCGKVMPQDPACQELRSLMQEYALKMQRILLKVAKHAADYCTSHPSNPICPDIRWFINNFSSLPEK